MPSIPQNFLGIPESENTPERARVLVFPVPYERTVSYGTGTRNGPAAILEASRFVELYDDELDADPHDAGIHTLPPWIPEDPEPDAMVDELEIKAAELLQSGRMLFMLGGEHSVSPPVIRAHARKHPGLSILHFDAHGDLRDEYEGSRNSHACAARRFVDCGPSVHVGIRSLSREEVDFVRARDLFLVSNREMHAGWDWMEPALERLTGEVYVTFDIDFLDGSLVPGTGTPEPGGGTYAQALEILRRVACEKKIIGADLVEHAPLAGNRAPDFLAAKLAYKMIAYALLPERAREPILSPGRSRRS
ncbi:MAG: agmatinase [Thermoanaerobaculia bacterium]